MGVYQESDYYPILMRAVRPGTVVPFDCYLLLKALDRIVHYVRAGDVFPKEKLDKLAIFKVDRLHIKVTDKALYFAYLDSFFKTDDGQKALAEAREELRQGTGEQIPEEVRLALEKAASSSGEPQDAQGAAKLPESDTAGDGAVTAVEADKADDGAVKAVEENEDGAGSVQVASDATNGEAETAIDGVSDAEVDSKVAADSTGLGSLLEVLRSSITVMDDQTVVRGKIPAEDSSKIRVAALKVLQQITRVRALAGKEVNESVQATITEITGKISDNIRIISDIAANSSEEVQRVVRGYSERLLHGVIAISMLKRRTGLIPPAAIQGVTDKFELDARRLKHLLEMDEKALIEDNVLDIVDNVENAIGFSLDLARLTARTDPTLIQLIEQAYRAADDHFDAISSKSDLDPSVAQDFDGVLKKIVLVRSHALATAVEGDGADSATETPSEAATGVVAGGGAPTDQRQNQRLYGIIENQQRVIELLRNKLRATETAFPNAIAKFDELSDRLRSKLDQGDALKLQEFVVDLRELRSNFSASKNQSEHLIRISKNLSREAAPEFDVSKIKIADNDNDGDDGAGIGAHEPDITAASTLVTVPEPTQSTDPSELRTENDVLRIQLQNAKSLIESGEKKNAELIQINDENDRYIETLEKENSAAQSKIQSFMLATAEHETKMQKFEMLNDELGRSIALQKAELEGKNNSIRDLESQITHLEKDMRVVREHLGSGDLEQAIMEAKTSELPFKPEFVALLHEKEKAVTKKIEELTRRNNEIRENKREIIKLQGHVQSFTLLKKQMSARLTKTATEKENMQRNQEALNRKVILLERLAESERKSVARLTAMIQQLRKERMEWITKTSTALRGHKEMITRAEALSTHVESEINKNKVITEQLEQSRADLKEFTIEVGGLRAQIRALEAENKRLTKQAEAAMAKDSSADALAAAERKIAALRGEIQELKAQYASEQQKTVALSRELRAAMLKLKKDDNAA